ARDLEEARPPLPRHTSTTGGTTKVAPSARWLCCVPPSVGRRQEAGKAQSGAQMRSVFLRLRPHCLPSPRTPAARLAGARAVPPAAYHHAQPPCSLDGCSTAAPGLRSRACAAARCSCWWTASATPRRRRWPSTSASTIPSCVSVRPLGSATCSTATASRRPGDSEGVALLARAYARRRQLLKLRDDGVGRFVERHRVGFQLVDQVPE